MAFASLVTGNMGFSAHAASTIGSLTCRRFYDENINCNRSIRRKVKDKEISRRKQSRK